MKRIAFALATGLLCGQALAADLPMPAPPPRAPAAYIPVAPLFSWTGIYIGGNAGAAWNRGSFSDAAGIGFTLPTSNAVFTGGGQVGGNWQMGALVLGVEGQFDWLANQNNASAGIIAANGDTLQGISTDRWLTTLTGRVGFAADHWLFYAKGGGAWVGNQKVTINETGTFLPGLSPVPVAAGTLVGRLAEALNGLLPDPGRRRSNMITSSCPATASLSQPRRP